MPRLVALPLILLSQVLFAFSAWYLNDAPFMHPPMAPTKQWADGPMKLVATPQYETNKTDIFTTGATHMALLHNAIIRGYNSIYLQAPHVEDKDKADFIGYCQTWFKFVKSHHDDEEFNLFPKVKDLLGDEAVWTETHKEHESFLGGLVEFHTYLNNLAAPTSLSGTELLRIMESFQDDFENHFHSEIKTIAAIADHPKVPADDTPEGKVASDTFKTWGKNTVKQAGLFDVVPFFLVNLDTTFEDGMWKEWPPMPPPIKWGMMNIAGSWYSSYWKFSSCDYLGQPQELYALRPTEGDAKKDEL